MQDLGKLVPRHFSVSENFFVVRHSRCGKLLRAHSLDVFAVEPRKLVVVKNRGRLADTADIKFLFKLRKREDLAVILGAPAQQGDIVDDRLRKVTFVNKIHKACGAVTLGELGDYFVAFLVN